MRSYVRTGLGLGVVLALVIAVGCSSSDDSGSGGGGTGGTTSGGSAGKGGSGGSGTAGKANGGSSNAGTGNGTAGSSEAGAGNLGGESGGTSGPIDSAGAGGTDDGPKACNDLVFSGGLGTLSHSADAVPTFTYGTFASGNYRLTSAVYYDGNNGSAPYGEIARVAVSGQNVTIDLADQDLFGSGGTEVKVVMAQPNTSPPTSAIVECSSLPQLQPIVGQESKAVFQYTAAATTFSLYEVPLKLALTYTLEP